MRPITSKEIYHGRIFDLKKETFRMKGNIITRDIIYHPGSTVMIPLLDVKKQNIIMIRQYRHAAGGNIIEFPAGTREENESYRTCASRELIEETGYRAKKVIPIVKFYLAPGTTTEAMGLYLCRGLVNQGQELEMDEDIKIFETTLPDAVKTIFSGKIKDAKTICALLTLKNIYEDKGLYKKYLAS
jgi:ADP-ribose pyrophosphatase